MFHTFKSQLKTRPDGGTHRGTRTAVRGTDGQAARTGLHEQSWNVPGKHREAKARTVHAALCLASSLRKGGEESSVLCGQTEERRQEDTGARFPLPLHTRRGVARQSLSRANVGFLGPRRVSVCGFWCSQQEKHPEARMDRNIAVRKQETLP